MIEYFNIDSDQTATQISADMTIDSESDAYVILKNCSILRSKKHSVRKVNLFDEFKQKVIPNPLADWHRLDKCTLKPGSTTTDDNGEDDAEIEPDDADVSRARAERRRQNKQK